MSKLTEKGALSVLADILASGEETNASILLQALKALHRLSSTRTNCYTLP